MNLRLAICFTTITSFSKHVIEILIANTGQNYGH